MHKILLILTEFPPRIGGMQTHAVNLVRCLLKRRFEVEVVTYRASGQDEICAIDAFDTHFPCPIHRVLSRIGHMQNIRRLIRLSKEFEPDLIYASTVFYGRIGKRLGIPMVARSVGNDVQRPWIVYPFSFMSRLTSHPILEDKLYAWFKRLDSPEFVEAVFKKRRREIMIESAHCYQKILANSEYTSELLEGIGIPEAQIKTVIGGVDYDSFSDCPSHSGKRTQMGFDDADFLLITVCRLVPKKGVDFLIEHMPRLRSVVPNLKLLIVGSGRKLKSLKAQAARSVNADSIHFTGKIPHEQIQHIYGIADAMILASRIHIDPKTGLQDAETMGRVLCEANAAQVPVLASASGGIPSVIEHEQNGLLFKTDDIDSLCLQLKRLSQDPALCQTLIKTGRNWAETRFDWSIIMDAHADVFNELVL